MLQSIENNAGIIGEHLALLRNYYVMCALNRLLTCVEPVCTSFTKRQERSLQDYVSLSIMFQYNSKH